MSNMELRQIHKIRPVVRQVFVEDPQTGAQNVQERHQFVEDDTDRVSDADGKVWEIQPDKSFLVPVSLAEHLCRMPGWRSGPNPFYDPDEDVESRGRQPARKPRVAAAA